MLLLMADELMESRRYCADMEISALNYSLNRKIVIYSR